jgi:exodeoxyribonuclease VII large subunit
VARKKAVDALQFSLFAPEADDDQAAAEADVAVEEAAATVHLPATAPEHVREHRLHGLQLAREALEGNARPAQPAQPAPPTQPAQPAQPTGTGSATLAGGVQVARSLGTGPYEHVSPGSASDAALSVSAFYERLRLALRFEFPDEIWVTGEIRKVTVSKGHRYIELADHDPDGTDGSTGSTRASRSDYGYSSPSSFQGQGGSRSIATLDVSCWSRQWPAIAARLDSVGVELVAGLVVRVRGRVSVWDAGAKVRFSMSDLDVEALVGGIAAARRKLLTTLESEGIIDANRRLPVPPVPLRIGLVTSANSEAHRDFTGQLDRSGLRFAVRLEHSLVQGAEAPLQIAAALRRLRRVELDLVVLVRGGGAKGDLAAFDHEAVARAILECDVPVWTGIGHTGDRSVADEIANRALVTPTACGEAVVGAVAAYLDGLATRASRLAVVAERALETAVRNVAARRSDLTRAARHELATANGSIAQARGRLEREATVAVERCASALSRRAGQVVSLCRQGLAGSGSQVERQHALLAAFDPRRQLERGWSLTRRSDGSIVRSVDGIQQGDEIVTVVADGTIVSGTQSVTRGTGNQVGAGQ